MAPINSARRRMLAVIAGGFLCKMICCYLKLGKNMRRRDETEGGRMVLSIPTIPSTKALMITSNMNYDQLARNPSRMRYSRQGSTPSSHLQAKRPAALVLTSFPDRFHPKALP